VSLPTSLIEVVNSGSFHWACHCSYIFIPCLAFRVHVAGDLNQKILFVVDVLFSQVCSLAVYSSSSVRDRAAIFN